MTVSATPTPFPIESALTEALSLFQKNAAAFVIVLLIGGAPSFLGQLLVVLGGVGMATFAGLLALVGIVTSIVASASVQSATLSATAGGSADVNAAVSGVTARLLPLIGLGIVVVLAVGIGLVLLIVPGVIIACALCVAIPVFLEQNTGISDSLQRSYALTKGNWLRLFLTFLAFGIVAGIASFIVSLVFGLILGGLGGALASWAMNAIVGAYSAILLVVVYRKLKTGSFA